METIDLHGVKHADVRRALDIFYWRLIQQKAQHAKVITGNSSEMKSLVKETSSEYGFSVMDTDSPYLIITLV